MQNSKIVNKIPQSASMQPGSMKPGQKPGNQSMASISIGTLSLPSVTNPQDFYQSMVEGTKTGFAYSGSSLA